MNINSQNKRFFKFFLKRIFHAALTIFAVSLIIFLVMELTPGDPAILALAADATPETLAAYRHEMGLDLPLYKQYFRFIKGIFTGDFGRSYQTRRSITEDLSTAIPITLVLTFLSIAISSVIGVFVGVISAVNRETLLDDTIRIVVLAGVSIPIFWLGLLLIYYFAIKLHILPAMGWGTPKQMVLPVISLAVFPLALFIRFTRSSMLEVIRQDYIRTALAKGLPYRTVIYKHALRNALIPIITVIGLQFAVSLGGALMTESIFNIPGMGRLLVFGIYARDYPVIRGCIMLASLFFIGVNLLIDIIYTFIDPRISL
ncbi:MAG: ABC transporter permease [Actinobacteria bacterium]|nr:ABC transporter permease [Actinomycetota bacterium]